MGKIIRGILAGIASTLILLVILELVMRLAGVATGANSYVETIIIKEHLTTHKASDEFRVFTYGESTMHGSHYSPYSNPARWLEAYLKEFLPAKNIRIINFSRMGQGSDFIYRSFFNTAVYKPDLVVFYMGHNFFMPGNRVDQVAAKEKKLSFRFKLWARKSVLISNFIRIGIKIRIARGKDKEGADILGSEMIEAGPSGIGMENQVVRDSQYYRDNLAHHFRNVERIQLLAKKNHIPLIFFNPVGNLKDFPPSCSVLRTKLEPGQKDHWQELYEKGQKAQAAGDLASALQSYEAAAAIDPNYADLQYRLGQVYLKNGDLQKARQAFVTARDEDCIIVRANSDVQALFTEIKKNNKDAVVIDTEKALIGEAPGGILGDPIVEDNVHLSVKGHAILGRLLAQEIADHNWIALKSEWQFDNERSFDDISQELGITPELVFSAYLKNVSFFGSKYESRILYAKKALAIHPEDPTALRHLAWSYWLKGDNAEAFNVYEKLGKIAPDQLKGILELQPGLQQAFEERKSAFKPAA